jgi:hypothetical protein
MNSTNNTFATARPIGQTKATHAIKSLELPGNCSDKISSTKMKKLKNRLSIPFILLIILGFIDHSMAQDYNFLATPSGTGSIYSYTVPPSMTAAAQQNAFFGNGAGYSLTSGNNNALFGYRAGYYMTSGVGNSYFGLLAGTGNQTGSYNAFFGFNAGSGTTGSYSTFVGYDAGNADWYGSDNTFFGGLAGPTGPSLSDCAAIGYNALVGNSDEMEFGDANITKWGFGVDPSTGNAFQVGNGPTNGNGAFLTISGVWNNASDVNKKENFVILDNNDILAKVANLSIPRWNYKGDDPSIQHIGPMAQDFYSTFHVGNNDKSISTIDPAGIALVCVKALNAQNQVLKETVNGLQSQNTQLQNSVDDLQSKYNNILSEIENLKTMQAQCCGNISSNTQTGSNNDNNNGSQASLAQNSPNPFSQNTIISYYLPANMSNAVITIRSTTGTTLQSYNITSSGHGQINVSQGTLAPATYEYDLMVNGKLIDSKKMVIIGQ